jgi:tRNA-uridine 2-sulfurtransferase
MSKKEKVVVAMSGGVDSSVTAALLVEQGYEVEGASLRLWEAPRPAPRSCSDHRGAAEVAAALGIRHAVIDARAEFARGVVRPFVGEYIAGRTPNPCVACNRDFKLGLLLDWAKSRGADYVATGHYARIARDPVIMRAALLRGVDRQKDQSYFLFPLSQEQLASTLFPLGELEKSEVRAIARRLALSVAERPDSQDVCFGDYRSFVESLADPAELHGGEIVDRAGNILGHHKGLHSVTIGQRKGLGLSSAQPLYVLEIDELSRRVVVGGREELNTRGLTAASVNWIDPPTATEFSAEVQVRYRAATIPCRVRVLAGGRCEARFESAFPAVTPGQAAVFYRDDRVLGGGWIDRSLSHDIDQQRCLAES